jgi:hypothetical protein
MTATRQQPSCHVVSHAQTAPQSPEFIALMIAALFALALAAAQPATPPANTTGADDQNDASSLETLRQVYQTSCADRDFYTYSDVCDQLRRQVHAAEVAADKAARDAARQARRAKTTPPAPVQPPN